MVSEGEAKARLSWLGHPAVEDDEGPVTLETSKTLALLGYLSLSRRPLSRESLAALFWSDFDRDRAPANLRRTLSSLNASLKGGCLDSTRETVRLEPSCPLWVDVLEFEELLRSVREHRHPEGEDCADCSRRLERAALLYGGEFFEGFNLKDCVAFDEWQDLRREGLRRDLSWTLQRLSSLRLRQASFEEAIGLARRWISIDNLHQPAHRAMMEALAGAGEISAALRQYEECGRVLEKELGLGPDAETRRLRERIRSGPSASADPEGSTTSRAAIPAVEPAGPAVPAEPDGAAGSGQPAGPWLSTKLFAPQSPRAAVDRPGLVALLGEAALRAKLTVVSAPAGFGKSSLLAEWARGAGLPVGWLSLDEEDNDPRRLVLYLVAAFRRIHPAIGKEALALLRAPQAMSAAGILTTLLVELEAAGGREGAGPAALVLDDFQVLREHEALQLFTHLLDHLPAGYHLLLGTRVDPPLALARYRLRGELAELRAGELRFTTEEARLFLSVTMGLELDEAGLALLEEKTEGWVAGLQLAALSLRGRDDPASFLAALGGTNRFILDYLLEEVFDRMDEGLRRFLLSSSILTRLCGPLCDAVTAAQGGAELLRAAEKANLFLIALDEDGRYYRFHHLFADLLGHRLAQVVAEPEIRSMHRRAGEWLAREGSAPEALRHFLAAAEYRRAGELIIEAAATTLARGAYPNLLAWTDALPAELITNWFELSVWRAYALGYAGRFAELGAQVGVWEAALPGVDDPAARRDLESAIALVKAELCDLRGDAASALDYALAARDFSQGPVAFLRVTRLHLLLRAYRFQGQWERAEAVYRDYARETEALGDILLYSVGAHDQAVMMKLRGRLGAAEELYRRTFDLAARMGAEAYASLSEAYAGLADLRLELNDLAGARALAEEALLRAAGWDFPTDILIVHICYARVMLALGDYGAAGEHLDFAAAVARSGATYAYCVRGVETERAKLIYARGQAKEAGVWLETRRDAPFSDPSDLEAEMVARARLLILHARLRSGDLGEALALLARLGAEAEAAGRYGRLVEILVLEAVARGVGGDLDGARRALGEALGLGGGEGMARVFLAEGEKLHHLLVSGLAAKSWPPAELSFASTLLDTMAAGG
jgi:LuxR family maltose regulon positive regulatory protein